MRLNFQKQMAGSQATLPVVGIVTLVLWFVLPEVPLPAGCRGADSGLWQAVPAFLQAGIWDLGLSLFCAALAVYLMAELNNTHVLLRVSSRMLSSMLALLLLLVAGARHVQPGGVVLLFSLASLFPLFATYQQPHPLLSFLLHLLLSVASLVFPKLLWMVPVYWLLQSYLRAFSLRCFVASLLAVALPYWFYGGVALLTDSPQGFVEQVQMVCTAHWADYTQLPLGDVLLFAFVVLLFAIGSVDFFANQFLDKTRTRIIHKSLIMHGIAVIVFICLQPHLFWMILPLLLVDTAVLFGHFFTLTHTRFSHICCLVLLFLAVVVGVAQYVPLSLLFQ